MRLNVGLSFYSILTLIFITLKLTHNIDWSWWWVLGPLWIPTAIGLGIFGLIISFIFVVAVISFLFG